MTQAKLYSPAHFVPWRLQQLKKPEISAMLGILWASSPGRLELVCISSYPTNGSYVSEVTSLECWAIRLA
jgi:hypothetical protein